MKIMLASTGQSSALKALQKLLSHRMLWSLLAPSSMTTTLLALPINFQQVSPKLSGSAGWVACTALVQFQTCNLRRGSEAFARSQMPSAETVEGVERS